MGYQQLSIVWICKYLNSPDTSLIEKKMKNYNYLKVYYQENETKIAKNWERLVNKYKDPLFIYLFHKKGNLRAEKWPIIWKPQFNLKVW